MKFYSWIKCGKPQFWSCWYGMYVCVIQFDVPKIKCTAVSGCAPVFHKNIPTHAMHTD